MKPMFSTPRFDVFHAHCERDPERWCGCDVYIAFFHTDDVPAPVCFVTILASEMLGNFVEWIEVGERDRRQGIATEVLRGLESVIGALDMEGTTEAGKAFVKNFCSAESAAE